MLRRSAAYLNASRICNSQVIWSDRRECDAVNSGVCFRHSDCLELAPVPVQKFSSDGFRLLSPNTNAQCCSAACSWGSVWLKNELTSSLVSRFRLAWAAFGAPRACMRRHPSPTPSLLNSRTPADTQRTHECRPTRLRSPSGRPQNDLTVRPQKFLMHFPAGSEVGDLREYDPNRRCLYLTKVSPQTMRNRHVRSSYTKTWYRGRCSAVQIPLFCNMAVILLCEKGKIRNGAGVSAEKGTPNSWGN